MTTTPSTLPTEAEIAAEEAALNAAEATAYRLTRDTPRQAREDRVAAALAAAGLSGSERLPATRSERPRAASLLAWAEDPVATVPPLRLASGALDPEPGDPGDTVKRGGFALAALARAIAPDLAARGWTAAPGGRLAHDGRPASADVLTETAAEIVRQAAQAAREPGDTLTEPATWTGVIGGPLHRPAPRYAEHLDRLVEAAVAEHVADGARRSTYGRSLAAGLVLREARALVETRHDDPLPLRYVWPLMATVADLAAPRARRILAALVRDRLPAAAPTVAAEATDAARGWLSGWLSGRSGAIPRADLGRAYAAAGSPGDLDRPGLYALATDVLGAPRKRAGSWVFVAEAAA